jgi:transposase
VAVQELERFIKPDLTDSEVEELLSLGSEATKWAILEITARWREAQEEDKPATGPNTPSSQIPVYQKPNVKARPGKMGAKEGHEGKRRPSPERIDEVKEHTLERCPCCGEVLGSPFEVRIRITEDIPETRPVVIEHHIGRFHCQACGKTFEAPVTEALPGATIGNNILILSAWMHYGLGTTLSQIIQVLQSHLSFKISEGGLIDMWRRLSKILEGWYEELCLEARSKAVLHADETGWRVNGKTYWLWCFTSKDLTCYFINKSRGSPALLEFMGETFGGCLVTDFFPTYNVIETDERQYCLAHLFRKIDEVDSKNKTAEWKEFRKKLTRILKDAIRLRGMDGSIPEDSFELKMARLHDRLSSLVKEKWTDHDVMKLTKRLDKYENGILTFLLDKEIPYTNNHAEREIRPAVIMRKVIQQNRSDKSAHTQEILMTVFRTLKLRGHDPVKTVVAALSTYIETGKLPPFPEINRSDG